MSRASETPPLAGAARGGARDGHLIRSAAVKAVAPDRPSSYKTARRSGRGALGPTAIASTGVKVKLPIDVAVGL